MALRSTTFDQPLNWSSKCAEKWIFHIAKALMGDFIAFRSGHGLAGQIMISYAPRRRDHKHFGGSRIQFHSSLAWFLHILHCTVVRRNIFGRRYSSHETFRFWRPNAFRVRWTGIQWSKESEKRFIDVENDLWMTSSIESDVKSYNIKIKSCIYIHIYIAAINVHPCTVLQIKNLKLYWYSLDKFGYF